MLRKILYLTAKVLASVIMIQTLYFKFSGSAESVYIFNMVQLEPWGRWFVGIMELIASILLLIPRTSWIGGFLGMGLMVGAIGMHLTLLGIEVMNDGGYLFYLAWIVLVCCSYVIFANSSKIKNEIIPKILNR